MLAPDELVSAAKAIFAAPSADSAARATQLEVKNIRAATTGAWRLLHFEAPGYDQPSPPMFGRVPELPAPTVTQTKIWTSRNARLSGRRGLIGEDGSFFLGGPVRGDADLARAAAASADGGEGLMLRAKSSTEAQLLVPVTKGERRLTGIGLHLGAAAGPGARPFVINQFLALLLIAELQPRFDYLVLDQAPAELPSLLAEVGYDGLPVIDLDRMQGVICAEIIVPVVSQDGAGWVDRLSSGRLREFAQHLLSDLGSEIHPAKCPFFLTTEEGETSPLAGLAAGKGFKVRAIEKRTITDRALLMTQASHLATDCDEGVLASLFADLAVPLIDFSGTNAAKHLPLLAGRPYAFAETEDAEAAFAEAGVPELEEA